MTNSKIVIVTAPSGSGKTTLVGYLLKRYPILAFSVSATTRTPRGVEVDGKDYYFLSVENFKENIDSGKFLEWEMVYPGKYYGTLKSELERIWQNDQCPLVDIDVQGALRVKKQFKGNSLSLFIKAPSIEVLAQRLRKRGTETDELIRERLDKASGELKYAKEFDGIIVNDVLEDAVEELCRKVAHFLEIE